MPIVGNFMEIIKVNLNKTRRREIDLIVDYFQKGKVVVYPTDTVYGLGCRVMEKQAVKRIFEIKQRPKSKPFLVLVNSLSMLKKYSYLSVAQEKYLKKIWPGPITVVLKSRGNLPAGVIGKDGGLAARLPKNNFLITILKRLGEPIVSTSLNISGQKNLTNLSGINNYFGADKPDLVVDAGILPENKPSRVIDIREIDNIKILRW